MDLQYTALAAEPPASVVYILLVPAACEYSDWTQCACTQHTLPHAAVNGQKDNFLLECSKTALLVLQSLVDVPHVNPVRAVICLVRSASRCNDT